VRGWISAKAGILFVFPARARNHMIGKGGGGESSFGCPTSVRTAHQHDSQHLGARYLQQNIFLSSNAGAGDFFLSSVSFSLLFMNKETINNNAFNFGISLINKLINIFFNIS
jgi:hypothetical protein